MFLRGLGNVWGWMSAHLSRLWVFWEDLKYTGNQTYFLNWSKNFRTRIAGCKWESGREKSWKETQKKIADLCFRTVVCKKVLKVISICDNVCCVMLCWWRSNCFQQITFGVEYLMKKKRNNIMYYFKFEIIRLYNFCLYFYIHMILLVYVFIIICNILEQCKTK